MTGQAPIPAKAPAGWYPEGVNGQRYWDGAAWTDHRAPAALVAAAAPPLERNHVGDIALVLVLLGCITAVGQLNLVITVGFGLIAFIVAIVAITRPGKRKATGILALVFSPAPLLVAFVVTSVINR